MRIAIGSDHRGLDTKKEVIRLVTGVGHSYKDFGTLTTEPVDYPDIAKLAAGAVAEGGFQKGILICMTGVGMCIAANKVAGIRAALCQDSSCARRARAHNDINILCLSSEMKKGQLPGIVDAFLGGEFEGGRHQRRLDKIRAMEG